MQRHIRHFVTAIATPFRAGKPLIEFDYVASCRLCLVLQLHNEAMPVSIVNAASQFVVFIMFVDFNVLHDVYSGGFLMSIDLNVFEII